MPPNPTPAEPTPAPVQSDTARYTHILQTIIDIGLRHIQATDPATNPTPPEPGAESPAATYDRLARSVRRSIMLAEQLASPKHIPAERRTAARKQIIRAVEDIIQRGAAPSHAEALHGELLDRLETDEFEHDIATRPTDDIIQDICRDLGLDAMPGTHPYKRRTPDDLADLHALAAQPASPAPESSQPSPPGPRPPRTRPRLVPAAPPGSPLPRPTTLAEDIRFAQALLGEPAPVHDPP